MPPTPPAATTTLPISLERQAWKVVRPQRDDHRGGCAVVGLGPVCVIAPVFRYLRLTVVVPG